MKPTIIILQGRGNSGKTRTLLRVISRLEQQPGAKILTKESINGNDMFVIILVGNKKIGITTQGDPNSTLEIKLRILIEISCDIVLCACRTRGSTVAAINEYEASCRICPAIRQEYADGEDVQSSLQEKKANEILSLIFDELRLDEPSLIAA